MIPNYPKISIITPSLNQGKYIEQAIKSVLSQNYPNFEHIIMDGGSTDNTLSILKKYPHLIWKSQKDNNHIEAVNKGIKLATGEIMTVLNSDDFFEPNIFFTVQKLFKNRKIHFVCGNCNLIDKNTNLLRIYEPHVKFQELLQPWKYEFPLNPSAYFYKRSLHKHLGLYLESIGPIYDYEFILRVAFHYPITYTYITFGNYRIHPDSITSKNQKNSSRQLINTASNYWKSIGIIFFWKMKIQSTFLLIFNQFFKNNVTFKKIAAIWDRINILPWTISLYYDRLTAFISNRQPGSVHPPSGTIIISTPNRGYNGSIIPHNNNYLFVYRHEKQVTYNPSISVCLLNHRSR